MFPVLVGAWELAVEQGPRRERLRVLLAFLAPVALVLALLLQPSRLEEIPPPVTNRVTIIAVDDSRSMAQTDVPQGTAESNRLRGRVALMMPTPRPTISQSTTPPMTTDAVRGRSWARIVLTDSPLA